MPKRISYLSIYLFIYLFGNAQINLVPNYSFEDTLKCFVGMGVSNPLTSNNYLKNWYTSNQMTPEYNNICANSYAYPSVSAVPLSCWGYQSPRTGNAYVGASIYSIINPLDTIHHYAEYISVKLKDSLKPNKCYYGEFYISLADHFKIGINQIGMLLTRQTFSSSITSFTNTLQPKIQWDTIQYFTDTLNWVKISGTFIAQGGEQHLTIGNFKDGSLTKKIILNSNFVAPCNTLQTQMDSYIFIDDVSLYELPTPQLQSNAITICPDADSLVLGDTARIQSTYKWYANGNLIANTSFITVKPSQTTTYVLQTTQCNVSTQTVVVTYSANCEPIIVVEPIIPNVFTPNNDSINDVWRFNLGKGNSLKALSIYNRWGNLIKNSELNTHNYISWDGRTTSGEPTASGIYFYVLQYTDANGEEHKKNGYITLIR